MNVKLVTERLLGPLPQYLYQLPNHQESAQTRLNKKVTIRPHFFLFLGLQNFTPKTLVVCVRVWGEIKIKIKLLKITDFSVNQKNQVCVWGGGL
jgi:hypothetical protein